MSNAVSTAPRAAARVNDSKQTEQRKAALAWLTGDEGLETISLLRLQ